MIIILFHLQLAKKYHPDRNKEADASKKFSDAAEAYEVSRNWKHKELFQFNTYTFTESTVQQLLNERNSIED